MLYTNFGLKLHSANWMGLGDGIRTFSAGYIPPGHVRGGNVQGCLTLWWRTDW